MHKKVKYYRARSKCRLLRPNASRGERILSFFSSERVASPVATGEKSAPSALLGQMSPVLVTLLSTLSSVSVRHNANSLLQKKLNFCSHQVISV
ncbi:hypothetical protein TNCT_418041 [Trichonephila clavata]|uniref:Uncharacterized protein n=1 Tax=Trichonephila clavata TaxID=2740835 RepID=A0A8X6KQQ4_TRICU|nr:hypothetical protein TNCT_418041 [Trichonephila clavata]